MTKEEARKNIIAFTIAYADEDWPVEIGESLGMAISALSENKGKWIPVYGKNGKTIMSYKCSKCDFHPKHAIITDFCGGCGADMRGKI